MEPIALPRPRIAPAPNAWKPLKLWRRQIAAQIMRRRVVARDFTIISNDCWGGMAYEELGIRYETPFVGLFFMLEDYMQLLRQPRLHLETPLEFSERSRHAHLDRWRHDTWNFYPIGLLGDVEIQFLHYKTREEAAAKWSRRVARVNWNKLLVKLCWHDDPRMKDWLREFEELPFTSKLSLTPKSFREFKHSVALSDYSTNGTAQYWSSHRHFDIAAWINSGSIRRASWSRALDWFLYWRY